MEENMRKQTKLSGLVLILIGVLAGALVFTSSNGSNQQSVLGSSSVNQVYDSPANRPVTTLKEFNQAFVDIAKAANPTVITVFTEKVFKVRRFGGWPFFQSPFEDFFGRQPQQRQEPEEQEFRQRGLGSGVIVSEDGYTLTNNHVIKDADTINVRLHDERTFPAKIVGVDPQTDLAVLKIDADNLPDAKIGDSDKLQVGEWVLAIGSPLSPDLAHSVTRGMVSAKGRSNVGLADYEDFIQTDAAINPGNSVGALINLDGELVGINIAIASRSGGFQGIGFAVPINMAHSVMKSLIKHGKVVRGWLGVYIQDVDETMAEAMDLPVTEGVLVSDVVDDSPADKAGLQEEDVITELDREDITSTTQLRNEIASTAQDTEVQLKIIRNGKTRTVNVKLGKLEPKKTAHGLRQKMEDLFGFNVSPLDRQTEQNYGTVVWQI
jgi:serine protease Do